MTIVDTEQLMRDIAKTIDAILREVLGEPKGFALIMFEFNQEGIGNYISNARREDMIKALRETADRIEANADISSVINKEPI